MNAYELADYITENSYIGTVTMEDVATMLRQQQNEIEDLKNANRFIQNFAEEQHQRAVALEMRELTDEEIMEVATINLGHSMGLLNWMGFARAILRKAQEK
jgi:sorbitol-specific phosphotransferase system component IIBC